MRPPTKAELLAERQEIIAALAKRDPPQFDDELPLEVRIEAMVRRETELCKLFARYRDALILIATCESHTPGNIVDIAQKALATHVGR